MEYYTHSRHRSDRRQSTSTSPDVSRSPRDESTLPIEEHSIYIFPNPSSTPASPSGTADRSSTRLGIATGTRPRDVSVSSITQSSHTSDLEWEEVDSLRSPSSSLANEHGVEVWEWSLESGAEESESVLEEEITRASRWDFISQRSMGLSPSTALTGPRDRNSLRVIHTADRSSFARSRTQSSVSSVQATIVPHARIQLPLLSFFASLFSVDESTLHLISYTPSHSILFPTDAVTADAVVETLDDGPHGMFRLLTTKERPCLQDTVDVACDSSVVPANPFLAVPLPFTDIIGLVKGVWNGGGRALKEIWN
ncbi:hypothetical protein EWM64_g641 [Hericium alpestre]|uniref:Uncharacterized protein n=1 Tax=Hericium alpestre TaxID=135208 RepID=A0A4Z0A9I7_9AGAM|nr:hypothetical protein EWM64_g641 [Hericium alpestre]